MFEQSILGNVVDPARPVLSMHYVDNGPFRIESGNHSRAHLHLVCKSICRVSTAHGGWVIPQHQAIWIPSHLSYEFYSNTSANIPTLYIDKTAAAPLPAECIVFSVTPLLHELILRIVECGNKYASTSRAANLFAVLLDELHTMKSTSFSLPLANDKRVLRIMERLIDEPENNYCLADLGSSVGASARTIERIFAKETGITFSEWRKRLRLAKAVEQLRNGSAVNDVAMKLGYRSSSAFTAMFRRTMGLPPSRYSEH